MNSLGDIEGKKILDIGCGMGGLSILCSKNGAHVTGIDISSSAIKFAKQNDENQDVNFLVSDAENISLTSNYFDIIICTETLEHVNPTEALKEIKRLLKPDGKILITTPNHMGPYMFYMYLISRIKKEDYGQPVENIYHPMNLKKIIRNVGLNIDNMSSMNFLGSLRFFLITLPKSLIFRLLGRKNKETKDHAERYKDQYRGKKLVSRPFRIVGLPILKNFGNLLVISCSRPCSHPRD